MGVNMPPILFENAMDKQRILAIFGSLEFWIVGATKNAMSVGLTTFDIHIERKAPSNMITKLNGLTSDEIRSHVRMF